MQEGSQSAYSQMKVEDRLRLKGSKLKENSNFDNRSYRDQQTTPGRESDASSVSNITGRKFMFEGQRDTHSVSSRTSDLRSMNKEFEKKQMDYALRSQQLQQKLKQKYEATFPEFKAQPITYKQEMDTVSMETTST